MKEVEDYLHLYLGCEVRMMGEPNEFYILNSVSTGEEPFNWCSVTDKDGRDISGAVPDCFPVLRQLSDMTEEEMKEVVLTKYMMRNTLKTVKLNGNSIDWTSSGFSPRGSIDLMSTDPEIFRYLLSKSFDLFGLIEADLAIDKIKINK